MTVPQTVENIFGAAYPIMARENPPEGQMAVPFSCTLTPTAYNQAFSPSMSQMGLSQVRAIFIDNTANSQALNFTAGATLRTFTVPPSGRGVWRVPTGQGNFNFQLWTNSAPAANVKIKMEIYNYAEEPYIWEPVTSVAQSGPWNINSIQSGTWNVAQSGAWNVTAVQSGTWNVAQSGAWNVNVAGSVSITAGTVNASITNSVLSIQGNQGSSGVGLSIVPTLSSDVAYNWSGVVPLNTAPLTLDFAIYPQNQRMDFVAGAANNSTIFVQFYSTRFSAWFDLVELVANEKYYLGKAGDIVFTGKMRFFVFSGTSTLKINIWHS